MNPRDIPGGYCETKHKNLRETIAEQGSCGLNGIRMMACHESPPGKEQACVGWLNHQLGVGNNIGLRLLAIKRKVPTDYELDGPQHIRFEDTLPKKRRRQREAARGEGR